MGAFLRSITGAGYSSLVEKDLSEYAPFKYEFWTSYLASFPMNIFVRKTPYSILLSSFLSPPACLNSIYTRDESITLSGRFNPLRTWENYSLDIFPESLGSIDANLSLNSCSRLCNWSFIISIYPNYLLVFADFRRLVPYSSTSSKTMCKKSCRLSLWLLD